MNNKTFKDYLGNDRVSLHDSQGLESEDHPHDFDESPEEQTEAPIVGIEEPEEDALEESVDHAPTREMLTEILQEQKEENKKLFESNLEVNKQLLKATRKLIEDTSNSNEKLMETVNTLSERLSLLEENLEANAKAIHDMEIPAPVVNVSLPTKRIKKEVHRDDQGFITHITENLVNDDSNEEGKD